MSDNSIIYYIHGKHHNGILNFAFNKKSKQIYEDCCEWVYLLRKRDFLNDMKHISNHDINYSCCNTIYKNDNVLPLISSWATGTTHGYAALYWFLYCYLNDIEHFKNYKIAFYKYSQKGMLDIINHLIKINKLDKNDIIYLDNKIPYEFKSITFIKNKYHEICSFPKTFDLFEKYIYNNDLIHGYDKIAIIKHSNGENLTHQGIMNYNEVLKFVNKYNIQLICPDKINEIKMINIIHNTNEVTLSWGTCFMKNICVVSDKCKRVNVLVCKDYKNQYIRCFRTNHLMAILKKYKNADVYYYIVEDLNNLDLNTSKKVNIDFNWENYVNRYKDLQKARINTYKKALRHYIFHGVNEGRNSY